MTDSLTEREVKDFQFKLLAKLRIQPEPENPKNGRVNHVAVSNRFGLIFAATQTGFKVIQSKDASKIQSGPNQIVQDFDFWTDVVIQQCPQGLSLSSDNLTLAVCITKSGFPFALMYDVRSFATKGMSPSPFLEVKLTSVAGAEVQMTAWNPALDFPALYAVCVSDGSMTLFDIKNNLEVVATVGAMANISCICWSPKGKQLVAGKKDGTLTQYDQKFAEKKHIPGAQGMFGDNCPARIIDVLWESTFVFFASYLPVNNSTNEQPHLLHIVCPKGGSPAYTDLEDICYGGGEDRTARVYFHMLAEWRMVVAVSANSLEAAVMAKQISNEALWEKWILDDSGRAELPMTADYKETWPMGMAVDFTSQTQIPIGDNQFYPASPILILLATDGVLVMFHMLNSVPGTPSLQRPAEMLTEHGARRGAVSLALTPQQQPGTAAPTSVLSTPSSTQQQPGTAAGNSAARTLFQTPGAATPQQPAAQQQFSNQATPQQSSVHTKPGLFGATPTAGGSLFGAVPAPMAQAKQLFGSSENQKGGTTSRTGFGFGGFGGSQGSAQTPALGAMSKPVAQSTPVPTAQSTAVLSAEAASKPPTSFSFAAKVQPGEAAAASPKPAVSQGSTQQPASSGFGFGGGGVKLGGGGSQFGGAAAATTGFTRGSTQPIQAVKVTKPPEPKPASHPTQPPARTVSTGKRGSEVVTTPHAASPAPSPPAPGGPQPTPVSAGPAAAQAGPRPVAHARRKSHESEDPFMKTIMEEMEHFQKELSDLKSRSSGVFEPVGNKAEMSHMVKNSKEMVEFCKEIKEQTHGINGEIHALKSQCLESFATLEECKAREERNRDPSYRHLLGSRSLDPMSERKLREIRTQFHYTDNGIRDVDLKLDMEWEEYQRKNKRGGTLKTPASDAIYRTITNNKRVIDNHMHSLDKLCGELRDLKLYNSTGWEARRRNSPAVTPNSSLNTSLMNGGGHSVTGSGGRPVMGGLGGSGGGDENRYQPRTLSGSVKKASNILFQNRTMSSMAEDKFTSSLSPQKAAGSPISPEKQAKLRDILGNRRVTPVKSTAPANLSMSRFVSSERLEEMTEASFSTGERELEESYLHTRHTAVKTIQNKAQSPVRTSHPSSVSRQQQPSGGGLLPSASKSTAFTAVNRNSPQLSPVTERKGFAVESGSASVNKMKESSAAGAANKAGSGIAIGGGLLGAKTTQGFSFGVSPAASPVSNFSSPMPPVSKSTSSGSSTPKTMTSNPTTSGANAAATHKPVPQTTSKSASLFGFGSGGSSLSGQMAFGDKSSVASTSSSPFVFNSPTPGSGNNQPAKKAQTGSNQTTQDKTAAKPQVSAGFNFNTSTTTAFAFGGADTSSADNKPATPQPGKTAFAFGGGTPGPDQNKGSSSSFAAFSGTGLKLGGSESDGKKSEEPKFALSTTPSITSDVMKGLRSEAGGGEGTGAGEGTTGAGLFSGFTAEDSSLQSLNTGDFQLGGALASILVEDPILTTSESTGSSNPEQQASQPSSAGFGFTPAVAAVIPQPQQHPPPPPQQQAAAPSSTVSKAADPKPATFGTAATGFGFGQSLPSTAGGGAGLFGGGSSVSFGGISATKTDSSKPVSQAEDATSFTATTAKKAAVVQPSDAPSQSLVTQPTGAIPSPTIIGDAEVSIVSSTSIKQQHELKSEKTTTSAVQPGFAFGGTSAVFGGSEANVPKTGFSFGGAKPDIAASVPSDSTAAAKDTAAIPTSAASVQQPSDSQQSAAATSQPIVVSVAPTPASVPVAATSTTPVTTGFGFGAPAATTQQPIESAVSTVTAVTARPSQPADVTSSTTAATGFGFGSIAATAGGGALFGSQPATTAATPVPAGLFGNAGATTQPSTTQPPPGLFGASTGVATSGSSATAAPLFGQQVTSTTGAATPPAGLFGQPSAVGTGGLFSSSQPNTATSTVPSGLFGSGGQATTGGFGSTSVTGGFGGGGGFGAGSMGTGGFGMGFGESGGATTVGDAGQAGTGMFGGGGSGGLFGLGGKPSAENANKNVFGSGFGSGSTDQNPQAQNLFGAQTSSTSAFNTVDTAGGTAGGPFSAAGAGAGGVGGGAFSGGGVSATGFGGFGGGAQQTPQKAGGFGTAPAFGSNQAFGSPPSFGSQATFGTSTFGTGAGVGGGAIFGSSSDQASSGFANFAANDGPTFGNLATQGGGGGGGFGGFGTTQQPQQPQQQPFGGGGGGGFGGFGGGGGFGQQMGQPQQQMGQQPNQPAAFGQQPQQQTSPSFSSYRG